MNKFGPFQKFFCLPLLEQLELIRMKNRIYYSIGICLEMNHRKTFRVYFLELHKF